MKDILTILLGLLISSIFILGSYPIFKQPINCRVQLTIGIISFIIFSYLIFNL